MCISFTSVPKSSILYCGLFVGLSVLPELLLIGVDCASFSHISSDDRDQRRLVKWSLLLACVTLLFKTIQLPFLSAYSIYDRRTCLLYMLLLWFVLNLSNLFLGILISIHLKDEKQDNSLRQSFLCANIALFSMILIFMLIVCYVMVGPMMLTIHQDDNRL
jgi:hypothetical protein